MISPKRDLKVGMFIWFKGTITSGWWLQRFYIGNYGIACDVVDSFLEFRRVCCVLSFAPGAERKTTQTNIDETLHIAHDVA